MLDRCIRAAARGGDVRLHPPAHPRPRLAHAGAGRRRWPRRRQAWFEVPHRQPALTRRRPGAGRRQRPRSPKGQSLIAQADCLRLRAPASFVSSASLRPRRRPFDGYQPWFAEIALTLIELRSEGAVTGDGVEATLSQAVPTDAGRAGNRNARTADRHACPKRQVADQLASLEETLKRAGRGSARVLEDPAASHGSPAMSAWHRARGASSLLRRAAPRPVRAGWSPTATGPGSPASSAC